MKNDTKQSTQWNTAVNDRVRRLLLGTLHDSPFFLSQQTLYIKARPHRACHRHHDYTIALWSRHGSSFSLSPFVFPFYIIIQVCHLCACTCRAPAKANIYANAQWYVAFQQVLYAIQPYPMRAV